ncbi:MULTISPECIES: SRPBCC family protein [unclassified Streptomyces]|uniref:SRPBCC family protein n=1 Tax=unclassified Streptomyces TaxID=2593676 RepID=UPI002E80FECF|nr:SRPBCC family protein [Streptomyces sp. NBC_00589]WTI33889.1 SRPBCC family protein [Streptomyces sp. NBC_00775]WUB32438.1 SRPBCC family protein [Streptomyces sp. NBC_00589]
MISIAEEITVPSPPQRVWDVVSDPSAVVTCIRGAELGESHDDGSFDGVLVVRFGGIRVRFAALVTLELDESEHEGRITARGRDGQGATRFGSTAVFRVADEPATGCSRVTIKGEVTLSGKLAQLIESGAGVMVSRMAKEFSAELVQRCIEPGEASTAVPTGRVDGTPTRRGRLTRLRAWWSRLLRGRRVADAARTTPSHAAPVHPAPPPSAPPPSASPPSDSPGSAPSPPAPPRPGPPHPAPSKESL